MSQKPNHNSAALEEKVKEWAERYASCDAESQKLNKERAEIREEVEEHGLDRAAFVEQVNLSKKSLKRKEGYAESVKFISSVIGGLDQFELWSHIVEEEKRKKEEREKKKEEKKKAKAAAKKKQEEYKPATDRKPGKVKSVGEAQAEAVLKAVD